MLQMRVFSWRAFRVRRGSCRVRFDARFVLKDIVKPMRGLEKRKAVSNVNSVGRERRCVPRRPHAGAPGRIVGILVTISRRKQSGAMGAGLLDIMTPMLFRKTATRHDDPKRRAFARMKTKRDNKAILPKRNE